MLTHLLAALLLHAPAVTGTVFLDRNANGHRDPGEPGVADVAVSNQLNVARTDRSGRYALPAGGLGVVAVSVPNGYRIVGNFWQPAGETLDFGLVAAPLPSTFTFIHASDTHLDSASLPRMRLLQHLVDSLQPAFVLLTGDLIRDALRVPYSVATARFDLFMREQARFTRPVWTAPGNHDIFGIERGKSGVDPKHPLFARGMYRHYLGPDYYSFNAGGVHFVALDTEDIDDQWYYGHVDSLQLAWLAQDLALVPPNTPVVTFNHIPFFTAAEEINGYTDEPPAPTVITVNGKANFRHVVSNAGALLELLRAHRYPLALGGHVHIRERLLYQVAGQSTRFENAAAIIGPSDGANLHFQSGLTLYRVTGGAIDSGRFIPLPDPPADTSHHQVRFVEVNPGVRVEVLDWGGKGPAMLFLAGLQDPAHEFDDFAPQWTDSFHVYGLTRRGYGASTQAPSGYQIDSLITDIRVVLDSLGVNRAILVGHSIAGDELTRFAAAWPERVRKLVYFDGAHDRVPLAKMFTETPAPPVPPMTRADSLSPVTFRAYWARNSGVQYTMGEVLAIAKFGPDGRYVGDVTPGTVDGAILAGLEHPAYAKIQAPALAFYAVTDKVRRLFPFYDRLNPAGKAQANRFNARFTKWAADERARFRAEVKDGHIVELRDAHHYIFMSNEAEVVRAMRAFLADTWHPPADSVIRRTIEARVAGEGSTGMVVGVLDAGKPRFIATGVRGAAGSAPLDQKTLFEIGSISKVFTTILLAHMVESGEVRLDDPAQQLLPAGVTLPSKDGRAITLLDLATATSGLPRMPTITPRDPENPYADFDAKQLYAFLNGLTLTRAPGASYEYSNLGMGLLGHLLALKAGKPYAQLVTERILRPLGMNETSLVIPEARRSRLAQGHNRELAAVKNWDFDVLAGAGGWRSTPEDMARFLQAQLTPPANLLGRAMQLAATTQRPTGIKDVSIGLGWHIINRNGQQIVFHNGETGGYHSWLGFNRAVGSNALILAASAHDIDDIALNIVDSTIPRRDPAAPRATVEVREAVMQEYVGVYELAPTFAITVSREANKLYLQATNQQRFRVYPASETRWFVKEIAAEIGFERDAAGKVDRLILYQGGRESGGRRVR